MKQARRGEYGCGSAASDSWEQRSDEEGSVVDPHELYLAGGKYAPLAQTQRRSARLRRARARAHRRHMLALLVPVLAFFAALCGRGLWGPGLQGTFDAAGAALAALKKGQLAEAAAAVYDGVSSLGATVTARRLLLPIFLAVVLRLARNKVIEKVNGTQEARHAAAAGCEDPLSPAAAAAADAKAKAAQAEAAGALSFELPRRLQHSLSGLVLLAFFLFAPFFVVVGCIVVALAFLYSVSFVRRVFPEFNAGYVHQLRSIIRPQEKAADRQPSAIPFLWGCLAVLLLSPRSTAALCVVLLSIGDPAAGLFRSRCRVLAAAAAQQQHKQQQHQQQQVEAQAPAAPSDEATDTQQQSCRPALYCGCRCSSGSRHSASSKMCACGIVGCTLVCAFAVVAVAIALALIAQHSPTSTGAPAPAAIPKFVNELLRSTLADGGIKYPWPSVLQPLAREAPAAASSDSAAAAAAADFTPGSRLLAGEPLSWGIVLAAAVVMGFVAALAEAVTVKGVDDNLSMPLICLLCFTCFFGVYAHFKGLAGASLGPSELRAMSSFDLIVLLLFAV
ncbi:hypothetical protein Efla_007617 [Eimeria flavescens]